MSSARLQRPMPSCPWGASVHRGPGRMLSPPALERVQARLLAPLVPEHRATLVQLLAQLVNLHNDIAPTPLRAAE